MFIRILLVLLCVSCNFDSSIEYANQSDSIDGNGNDYNGGEDGDGDSDLPPGLTPPGRGGGDTDPGTMPDPPADQIDGAKGDAIRGEPLYTNRCSSCHGNDGQGVGSAPRITQHTNFDFDETLKRGTMARHAEGLSLQELHDLKAYVDSLQD